MIEDPRQLANNHADILAARRSLHADELFHRQGITDVVDQRGSVVKPVRIGNDLCPGHLLATLSNPRWRNPTSTSQSSTFSPSSLRLNLMVPWVGWDGPICNSMFRGKLLGLSLHGFCKPIRSALVSQRLFKPQQFVLRPFIDEGSLHLALRRTVAAKD